jgi:hypothetical protein
MGTVYVAEREDAEFDQRVALKVVREVGSERVLKWFRYERQILASLEHPNIARLLDGGTTDEKIPYLVMEYVEGIPIDQYCAERKLSLDARLALFRQVCGGSTCPPPPRRAPRFGRGTFSSPLRPYSISASLLLSSDGSDQAATDASTGVDAGVREPRADSRRTHKAGQRRIFARCPSVSTPHRSQPVWHTHAAAAAAARAVCGWIPPQCGRGRAQLDDSYAATSTRSR